MKSARRISFQEILKINFLIVTLLLTISCSTVFFDTPQPVDSKNLSHVPGKIQGRWMQTGKTDLTTITIDNTSYHILSLQRKNIVKAKADSSKNYLIRDGKIYLKDEEFSNGYPFTVRQDTLFYTVRSDDAIVLSDSVILRRAKNCYVLNLKRKNWWEIVFIQKKNNGNIYISYPFNYDVVEMKSRCNVTVIDSTRSDSTYFHAEIKSRDIERVIPRSGGGIIYILKPDSTFETPH